MKLIRFTLLGLVFTTALVSGVNAQERGRGEQRRESSRPAHEMRSTPSRNERSSQRVERPQREVQNHRVERPTPNRGRVETVRHQPEVGKPKDNHRVIQRPDQRHTQKIENRSPQRIDNHTVRREPIRIDNRKHNTHYSYSKPIHNFDKRHYDTYRYNNMSFYGRDGIFYRHYNNNYVRFMPPIGFRINILPVGSITINIGNRPYYFYEGVYYERRNSSYYVAEPPLGAIVYALPSGYERIDYNGEYLYEFAGVLYDKIYHRGERVYQVVGYLS